MIVMACACGAIVNGAANRFYSKRENGVAAITPTRLSHGDKILLARGISMQSCQWR